MDAMLNKIQLPYVTIHYEEPIVYLVYKEGAELGFPEIRELIYYAEKVSGQKPYVTFSDVRMNLNITNEGKRVVENPDNMPLFRGTAILVKNNLYKFAVNFVEKFNNKKYPFRAFISKTEAIAWLLSLQLK
jgi:hypothetical protein